MVEISQAEGRPSFLRWWNFLSFCLGKESLSPLKSISYACTTVREEISARTAMSTGILLNEILLLASFVDESSHRLSKKSFAFCLCGQQPYFVVFPMLLWLWWGASPALRSVKPDRSCFLSLTSWRPCGIARLMARQLPVS